MDYYSEIIFLLLSEKKKRSLEIGDAFVFSTGSLVVKRLLRGI
jgi:hypothetical protein